ncbi:MAG TPA: DoxX family protein [Thermoanaerobaculia bacterium]
MKPILGRFYEHTYALLRIFTGAMFMIHGTQKILGWPPGGEGGGGRPPITSIGGIGGIIELTTGALVLVGLFTTIAAFLASGEMAVAYFTTHAPHGFIPLQNKGELAVLYCFVFLFIAANDGGDWSLDRAIFGRRNSRAPATA